MEVYVNGITGKKSFALIKNEKRIWGYDNYRYWHHHPFKNPDTHIPCSEPSLEKIANESAATSGGGPGPFQGPSSYPQLCWWSLIRDEILRISQIVTSSRIKFSKRVRVFTELIQ